MVHSCCVVGCSRRQSKDLRIKLHRLPALPASRREAWVKAIRRCTVDGTRSWTPTSSSRVCGHHFIEGKPSENPMHPDYVPTQNLGYRGPVKTSAVRRYDRVKNRARKTQSTAQQVEAAEALLLLAKNPSAPTGQTAASQTEPTADELVAQQMTLQCSNLQQVVIRQQQKIELLTQKLRGTRPMFGYHALEDDDFMFHTGLTRALFDFVLNLVKNNVKQVHSRLSLSDHLLVVFLKLRLALLNKDIAYRMSISTSSVSCILRSWIPVIAQCLKVLIVWPERHNARANIPLVFKPKYKNVISIIDCFEVFTERPYNLNARAQTWSNYKHNNTVKYLISITPFGSISFISEGWGGRVSDKQITLQSGYTKLLMHGDEVMADRGFLIRDECAVLGVRVHLPAFTKGKKTTNGQRCCPIETVIISANTRRKSYWQDETISNFAIDCSSYNDFIA